MFKAIFPTQTLEIEPTETGFLINGALQSIDVARITDTYFHVLLGNKSYRAELIQTDYETKTFTFKINGRKYPVTLKDKFDLLLEKMGMSNVGVAKVNHVKAPMPGLIIDLKVNVGDDVNQGDPLLILEAMKMENILKSPGSGKVKEVKIKKGDSVEKGQVLIAF